MGSFKLGKMTLRSLFGKPATVRYPDEQPRKYEALRGHVVNDMDTCILCGLCGRACPVGAIAVDRKGGTWTIDPYMCIQCACCVHECPKECLSMSVDSTPAARELSTTVLHKPEEPTVKSGSATAAGEADAATSGTKPKRELTPEQQARVEAVRKRVAEKKAAQAAAGEAAE